MTQGPILERSFTDPLLACIGQLAERFGIPCAPSMFTALPRSVDGGLPLHQAEAALDLLGLNSQRGPAKVLSRQAGDYPAIVEIEGAGPVVIHERREGDLLVWRPTTGAACWEAIEALQPLYGGWMMTVHGDPTTMREAGQPWNQQVRGHWFWSEIAKRRSEFWPVLLASLLINLVAFALPLFTMNVYDRVLPNRAQATLWVLALGVLLAFAVDYALRRARSRVIDQIGRDLDLRLSQKIFSKIVSTPLAQRRGHTGNLVARVTEFALVRDFFASTTVVLLVDLCFLVVFVALIAYIAGWLAFVPLAAMAVMAALGLRLQRKVFHAAQEAQADHGLQQTVLMESIAGMETLKSIAGEGEMLGRWRAIAELGAQSQQRLKDIGASAIGLASTFQQVSSIALVLGGYYLFDAGKITMGAIIAIVMLSARSLSPAGQIAYLLTRGQQVRQTLESLQRLWEEADERRMGSASVTPQVRLGHIKLENLGFAYPDAARQSLSGIDLVIAPGDRIAIIGRVAAGKSTLGRILCGLYQPGEGAMLVDGIDSRQYRPQDLRSAFRFVGQDAVLFSGTVKDNLALGAGRVEEQRLIDALRHVGAEQFLSQDAGGFDRAVGESGSRLSGGQRAFLALARAMVCPSRLLFLDEPTGAMDSHTEKLFVERLSQTLTPGQTLVISTHRPALFSLCNRLIVLDGGRIVADGPRDEVIASAAMTRRD